MLTTVIHIRSAPPIKDRGPEYVFIGRPGPYGNPFKAQRYGLRKCIQMYRDLLKNSPELVADIRANCAGKILICYCKPGPCHGDVIAEVADGAEP